MDRSIRIIILSWTATAYRIKAHSDKLHLMHAATLVDSCISTQIEHTQIFRIATACIKCSSSERNLKQSCVSVTLGVFFVNRWRCERTRIIRWKWFRWNFLSTSRRFRRCSSSSPSLSSTTSSSTFCSQNVSVRSTLKNRLVTKQKHFTQ